MSYAKLTMKGKLAIAESFLEHWKEQSKTDLSLEHLARIHIISFYTIIIREL